MEYKVQIAHRVHDDLDEIYRYLNENASQVVANRFCFKLRDRMSKLISFPEACPTAPENQFCTKTLRNTFVGMYRIIFYVEEQCVYVVHIRHSRRRGIDTDLLSTMLEKEN